MTCLITVISGKNWHAPCKILSLQQISIFCGCHKAVTNLRCIWPPLVFEDITGFRIKFKSA